MRTPFQRVGEQRSYRESFFLSAPIRKELKPAWGNVISEISRPGITRFFGGKQSTEVAVCIGDRTSQVFLGLGLVPRIYIVDGVERRNRLIEPVNLDIRTLILTYNPRGGISISAIKALASAWKRPPPVRVDVEGEEDILAVVAMAIYPVGTCVFYGQPGVGLVLVRINSKTKERAKGVVSRVLAPHGFSSLWNCLLRRETIP